MVDQDMTCAQVALAWPMDLFSVSRATLRRVSLNYGLSGRRLSKWNVAYGLISLFAAWFHLRSYNTVKK